MSGAIKVSGATFLHLCYHPTIHESQPVEHLGVKPWAIGRSYEFGKTANPHKKFIDSRLFGIKNPHTGNIHFLNHLIQEIYSFGKTGQKDSVISTFYHYDPLIAFHEANVLIYELLYIIREQIFEEVRRERFPSLPSRETCLFALNDSEKDLDYWINNLLGGRAAAEGKESFPVTLVKIRFTGKVFKTNRLTGVFLPLVSAGPDYWREQAGKYWSGSVPDSPDAEEVLLGEGVGVVESISPIEWRVDPVQFSTARKAELVQTTLVPAAGG
ncbi:MAG: DUF2441 domain-containing protein [Patescibacteria group bacterium]